MPADPMLSNPSAPPTRLLLTVREAAKALAVSEKTLYLLTAPRGPIRPVRIGRRVLYRPEALRQWAAEREQRAVPAEATT